MAPDGQSGFAIWACFYCEREADPLAQELIVNDCPFSEYTGMHWFNMRWITLPDAPASAA